MIVDFWAPLLCHIFAYHPDMKNFYSFPRLIYQSNLPSHHKIWTYQHIVYYLNIFAYAANIIHKQTPLPVKLIAPLYCTFQMHFAFSILKCTLVRPPLPDHALIMMHKNLVKQRPHLIPHSQGPGITFIFHNLSSWGGCSAKKYITLLGQHSETPTLIGTKFRNPYPYWTKIHTLTGTNS